MKTLFLICGLLSGNAVAAIDAVPHPETKFDSSETVLWSPLFQAAWDSTFKSFGPVIATEPPNPLANRLSSFKWDAAKVMPDGAWKTWTGQATAEFLDKVNAEAAKMTGEANGPFRLDQENHSQIATFGLLDREVTFRKKMQPCLTAPLIFKTEATTHPVRYFGLQTEADADAIRVISYNGKTRSHAIQLRCQEANDTVILYLPPQPQDFATACLWIRTWTSQADQIIDEDFFNAPSLHEGDEIRVPYLELESTKNFADSLDCWLRFKNRAPYKMVRAEQRTRFKLHEAGASVRSEASLVAAPFSSPPAPPYPRKFIYDRPFFVFLWREGSAWPYFGAWVGNADGMLPFEK